MKAEIGGIAVVVGSYRLYEIGLVLHDLKQRHVCGGDCIGKVQSLIFHGENPRFGFNWLCLTMFLLKSLF
jgi:hypothetical protein